MRIGIFTDSYPPQINGVATVSALLNKVFKDINQLQLCTPRGAFMYPLLIANGAEIRKDILR